MGKIQRDKNGKCDAEKCVQKESKGENWFEKHSLRKKKVRQGGAKSWMENAPRNIPRIVLEQFSRTQDDVSALRYKSPEVPGPQQTATATGSWTPDEDPLYNTDYTTNHNLRQQQRPLLGTLRIPRKKDFRTLLSDLHLTNQNEIQDADASRHRFLRGDFWLGEFLMSNYRHDLNHFKS